MAVMSVADLKKGKFSPVPQATSKTLPVALTIKLARSRCTPKM